MPLSGDTKKPPSCRITSAMQSATAAMPSVGAYCRARAESEAAIGDTAAAQADIAAGCIELEDDDCGIAALRLVEGGPGDTDRVPLSQQELTQLPIAPLAPPALVRLRIHTGGVPACGPNSSP